jgi:hypothetical protein
MSHPAATMQYINLLAPAFRKPRVQLSLARSLAFTVVAALLMSLLLGHDQTRVNGLREELASAQSLLKAQSIYTSRLKGESGQQGANQLDTEIQRLEATLKTARDSMNVLEGGALGNRDGFARYMQAFARQSLDGLWLTGFTVAGGGDVAIEGRVLRPELVPAYIQRLNGEPALKGRAFAALELKRPPPAPAAAAATATGGEVVPPKAETPRYIEFALTTAEPVMTAESRTERR